MPNEVNEVAGLPAPPAPKAADAAPAPQTQPTADAAPAPAPAQGEEMAQPSKREWVESAKRQRDIEKKLDKLLEKYEAGTRTMPPPTSEKPAATNGAEPSQERFAALERKLALQEVCLAKGLNAQQRDLLTDLTQGIDPARIPEMAEKIAALAPVPAAAPKPQPPPQAPPGRSDTGAPGVQNNAIVDPKHLNAVDPAVFKAMNLEDRKRVTNEFLGSAGNRNPRRRVGGS